MVFYTDDAEINHNNRNENGWISSGFVGGNIFYFCSNSLVSGTCFKGKKTMHYFWNEQ